MLCYQYQRLAVHLGHTRSIALSGLPPVHSSNVRTIASEVESTSTRCLFLVVAAGRSLYNCTILTFWHLVFSQSHALYKRCAGSRPIPNKDMLSFLVGYLLLSVTLWSAETWLQRNRPQCLELRTVFCSPYLVLILPVGLRNHCLIVVVTDHLQQASILSLNMFINVSTNRHIFVMVFWSVRNECVLDFGISHF